MLAQAICGVKISFSLFLIFNNGLSALIGSTSNTSKAAPAINSSSIALAKSASTL